MGDVKDRADVRSLPDGVHATKLDEDQRLGLFLQPTADDLKEDASAVRQWMVDNQGAVDGLLAEHGAIILRGFAVKTTADFSQLLAHYPSTAFGYRGGAAPRNELAPRVFESTQIPPEDVLLIHQEMSYMPHPPTKVAFYCRQPSVSGGETLIGDMRQVTKALPEDFVSTVADKGVCYMRNFRDEAIASGDPYLDGMHRSWQSAFETQDRDKAEADCADMGLSTEWLDDGSLSTSYVAPTGVRPHPATGEPVWFNQIAGATFREESIGHRFRAYQDYYGTTRNRPHVTTYGDRSPIPEDYLRSLYQNLFAHTQKFAWSMGDVMLVDNWFTAHGRNRYRGLRNVQVSLLY